MRAVPVGVASIVPHVTVRGNGGVGTRSDFRAGACPVARSPSCGGRQRVDAVGEAAGGEQEAGVADHPVVGADGEALHVPVADHRLP